MLFILLALSMCLFACNCEDHGCDREEKTSLVYDVGDDVAGVSVTNMITTPEISCTRVSLLDETGVYKDYAKNTYPKAKREKKETKNKDTLKTPRGKKGVIRIRRLC